MGSSTCVYSTTLLVQPWTCVGVFDFPAAGASGPPTKRHRLQYLDHADRLVCSDDAALIEVLSTSQG